jgi:hypothetical protein
VRKNKEEHLENDVVDYRHLIKTPPLVTDNPFCYTNSIVRTGLQPQKTMNCQYCGSEIADNVNFCPHCGATFLSQEGISDFATTSLAGAPRRRLDFGKLLNDTFALYKEHFGTMCLVGLILVGVSTVASFGSEVPRLALQITIVAHGSVSLIVLFAVLTFFAAIFQVLAQWYVALGAIRQGLYLAKGGMDFQTNMMFPPFRLFLKMVGAMFLVALITGGIMMIFLLPAAIMLMVAFAAGMMDGNGLSDGMIVMLVVSGLFYLVGACISVWCSIRLNLAQVFIADQDTGVIDSLRYSWRVTSGNFWMLLIALIVLGICGCAGMLLCCVGLILTVAIPCLGMALAYLQLTGQPNGLDYRMMQPPFVGNEQKPEWSAAQ